MSSAVDKIKERLGIVDIVGSYIKLEKAGGNFKAKCPFHNEKTPSFFVSPGRDAYYCFGCGAKGDILTFVQEFEGVDFIGALKMLATKAGIELEKEDKNATSERNKLHEILESATFFFQKCLAENKNAFEYLLSRDLTKETIKDWRLGYAPHEWRALYSFLKSRQVSEADMSKAGLIKKSEKKGENQPYDTFRGRVMFPISDSTGRIVGFSGRILKEEENSPKYLNSPETVLFKKSEILYGLHKAKNEIRRMDYSILVEGQTDLVTCHQGGFQNAVASSGTALSVSHLIRLKRLSNRIVIAFDADSAGFGAAVKASKIALELGMEIKIAGLPKGSDPAELIISDISRWKKALQTSKHIIDFFIDALMASSLDRRIRGREIQAKVLPFIKLLPSSIEQSHFIKKIAERSDIKEEALWEELKKVEVEKPEKLPAENKLYKADSQILRKDSIEKKIIGIFLWQESLSKPDKSIREIKERLEKIIGKRNIEHLFDAAGSSKENLIFEAEAYYADRKVLDKDIDELFLNLEEDYLKKEFARAMDKLSQAEKAGNSKATAELLMECQKISKKLSILKNKVKIT